MAPAIWSVKYTFSPYNFGSHQISFPCLISSDHANVCAFYINCTIERPTDRIHEKKYVKAFSFKEILSSIFDQEDGMYLFIVFNIWPRRCYVPIYCLQYLTMKMVCTYLLSSIFDQEDDMYLFIVFNIWPRRMYLFMVFNIWPRRWYAPIYCLQYLTKMVCTYLLSSIFDQEDGMYLFIVFHIWPRRWYVPIYCLQYLTKKMVCTYLLPSIFDQEDGMYLFIVFHIWPRRMYLFMVFNIWPRRWYVPIYCLQYLTKKMVCTYLLPSIFDQEDGMYLFIAFNIWPRRRYVPIYCLPYLTKKNVPIYGLQYLTKKMVCTYLLPSIFDQEDGMYLFIVFHIWPRRYVPIYCS